MKRTILVLAFVGAGVSIGRPAVSQRPNALVIVTLDTTRADRLSSYGYAGASMPNFERLAGDGVLFEHATSVAPLTLPAHTSLFTGLVPASHHVRDNADSPLDPIHITLAEALRGGGFKTAAFVGSTVLDADRGLAQGFDQYRDVSTALGFASHKRERRADAVIDDAVFWLGTVDQSPFFLWVHLNDAHRPYDPPEPFRSQCLDPYVGEIAFVDAQVGVLLATLTRHRLSERTIVVVVGDHGESLGEHDESDHGLPSSEGVLRVPLIIRTSGLSSRRIDTPVQLIDVMPTVLDLLAVRRPPMEGVSLARLMTGTERTLNLDRRQRFDALTGHPSGLVTTHLTGITRDVRERLGALGYVSSHSTEGRRTHDEDVEDSGSSAGVSRVRAACTR